LESSWRQLASLIGMSGTHLRMVAKLKVPIGLLTHMGLWTGTGPGGRLDFALDAAGYINLQPSHQYYRLTPFPDGRDVYPDDLFPVPWP